MNYSTLYYDIVNSPDMLYVMLRIVVLMILIFLMMHVVCFSIYRRTINKRIIGIDRKVTIKDYISDSVNTKTYNMVSNPINDVIKFDDFKDINMNTFDEIGPVPHISNISHVEIGKHSGIITIEGCPFDEEGTKGNGKELVIIKDIMDCKEHPIVEVNSYIDSTKSSYVSQLDVSKDFIELLDVSKDFIKLLEDLDIINKLL